MVVLVLVVFYWVYRIQLSDLQDSPSPGLALEIFQWSGRHLQQAGPPGHRILRCWRLVQVADLWDIRHTWHHGTAGS